MKRGLVKAALDIYPMAEWSRRLDEVQQAMDSRGLDWALVYGDVSASDDISYLTNICVYWNEGVLAVPRTGKPEFVTKLSARVLTWMKRVSVVDSFHSTPQLGKRLADVVGTDSRVAIVDAGRWPASLLEDTTASVGRELERVDQLISSLRATPAEDEAARLRSLGAELGRAWEASDTPGEVELALRRAGCVDVLIDDDAGNTDISAQFGHLWVRSARSTTSLAQLAKDALALAAEGLRADVTGPQIAARLDEVPAFRHSGQDLRIHVSLGPVVGGDLSVAQAAQAGSASLLSIDVSDGTTTARVADTYLIADDGAESLTGGSDERVAAMGAQQ